MTDLVLIRHGETAWNVTGQHTGRTDLGLNERGEAMARALGPRLSRWTFDRVLVSPLLRARQTATLSGYGARAEVVDDLAEWNYGRAEGRTKAEVRLELPGWDIWREGAPGGEAPEEIMERARAVAHRLAGETGTIAVFSHGHFLRVLTCAWLGWPVDCARSMVLGNTAISLLTRDDDGPELSAWNLLPAVD